MIFKLTINLAIFFLVGVQCQNEEIGAIDCVFTKCDVYCPYGHLTDEHGCETCQCFDPCCNYPCPYGEQCEVEPFFCKRPPCGYDTKCVPCAEPICPQSCIVVYKLDNKGCKTCECNGPCSHDTCKEDEYCTYEPISCNFKDEFCGVQIKCVKCPIIKCDLYCPAGFEVDEWNCPICKCKDLCDDVYCPADYSCVVTYINCVQAPCPDYLTECVSPCKDKQILLDDGVAVSCNIDDLNSCKTGFTCTAFENLHTSYCCGE